MRILLVLLMFTATFSACLNHTDKENMPESAPASTVDSTQWTTIQWLDSTKNLGAIKEGQVLKIGFRFKNAGDKPLILESVRPGCGCTLAEYPKEAIAPGKEGEIIASFDSKGREGTQHKTITVIANTAIREYSLQFDVVVKKS